MPRHPDFVHELSTRDAALGLRLAQALLRAIANETLAYRRSTEAVRYARALPSCQKRTSQARHDFNAFARRLNERLHLPHHVVITDYFRDIAGHVEENLEDWIQPSDDQPDKRINRYRREHDDRVRASDIRFLMFRDGLSYHEAKQAYDGLLNGEPVK